MVETCLRIDETGDRAAVARPFLRAMVWQEEDDDDRIQGLVNTLRDDGSTSVVKERAARQIAEYCDDWDEENKTRVRRSGGIDALLRLADRIEIFEPSLEKFVALALWRLSRIPEKNRTAILNGGGVEPLVRLVDVGRSDDAREGATAALVNLMGFRTQEICALVIDVGGLTPLVRLAQEATTDGAKIAAAMALKLIAEHENFKNCVRDAGGIGALCSLVMSEDATARIREEAAWALSYLVQKNAENKRALGAVKGVFSALLSIVEANNNENAQTVIANSGVTILCRVLKGRRKSDTAAAVSTAGEDEDFQDDNNDSLKAAAAAALIPLAENNEPVKVAIYNQGVVPCFSRLLNASDDKIKELATVMLCILTGVRARDGEPSSKPTLCRSSSLS
ncbi:hypothetical protein CTAYLR_000279 [Chrysophaeum taylorii]|uniref:Uncharacterized protein n=1 Tax=Chrysophaeum taylorii TaxID=2483200 RepID=A0AAD7UH23_9STRA|nr:hypothetical protein CTAYLR_000279 [Chrysophaeum taylorii]